MRVKQLLDLENLSKRVRKKKRPGPHRPVPSVLARGFELQALMDSKGWSQRQLADHLDISRAAVSQALRVCRLDARVKVAMQEKAEATGWRARYADIRHLSRLDVAGALQELRV